MPPKIPDSYDPNPQTWREFAEKDWWRYKKLLILGDPRGAGVLLQQSVEKFLKAFLISRKWSFQPWHDLDKLLRDALLHCPNWEQYQDACILITVFFYKGRYPMPTPFTITQQDVVCAASQVKPLLNEIRKAVI